MLDLGAFHWAEASFVSGRKCGLVQTTIAMSLQLHTWRLAGHLIAALAFSDCRKPFDSWCEFVLFP